MLGINETKRGEDFPDHLVSIDGFEIVQKGRTKLGGRVALYICDSVNFKVIDFLPTNSLEVLCIEILPKAAWPDPDPNPRGGGQLPNPKSAMLC